MLSTTLPAIDTTKICPAVAIWLVPVPQSDREGSGVRHQIQPFAPSPTVFEFIAAADFRRKAGQPEGQPFGFLIAPAELRPERVMLAPFVPKQHISTLPCYAKPGNAGEPRTIGISRFDLPSAPGHIDRRALPAPQPFACEPRTEIEGWAVAALKPSQPPLGKPAPIVFRAQAGGPAAVRPKQGLRELVLPSARPWHSLAILWKSFHGFHFAIPIPESPAKVYLANPTSIVPWNTCADVCLTGRKLFRESAEIPFQPQLSLEGARTLLQPIEVIEAVAPFLPGLEKPLVGSRLYVEAEPFPEAPVYETLPLPLSAEMRLPVIALPDGLSIWTESTNSYTRRHWSAPRLREGGRAIQTLRLAPSLEVNEPCEVSAA
jgi:hypothetical protein